MSGPSSYSRQTRVSYSGARLRTDHGTHRHAPNRRSSTARRIDLRPIAVFGNLQKFFLTGTGALSEISSAANAGAGVAWKKAPRTGPQEGGPQPSPGECGVRNSPADGAIGGRCGAVKARGVGSSPRPITTGASCVWSRGGSSANFPIFETDRCHINCGVKSVA